jgi:Domain of unknown function (DUF6431)
MSIVWPCPLTAGAYVLMGRAVRVPRPDCPSCSSPVVFWSGYWRYVRWRRGRCRKIFIPRVRCRGCGVTHALVPAFVLAWRLDAADPVGAVIGQVAGGAGGVRPAAARAGVPYTTARGWVRRFSARAVELAVGFSALAVELGGEVVRPQPDRRRHAVAAIGAAFCAAAGLPGWAALGPWRFAGAVTGGSLIAANATSPWLVIGSRRFMPPRSP